MHAWWVVAFVLGLIDMWYFRNYIRLDGITYLDMADALYAGNFQEGINSFWYPVYPLVLGFFQRLFDPSPDNQYLVVHASNFFLYLGALSAFQYFLKNFIRHHRQQLSRDDDNRLSPSFWITFSHFLFIWSSLYLTKIKEVTPDLVIEILLFVIFAQMIKIKRGHFSTKSFVLIGLCMGIGFLTKAFMLYLSIVFMICLVFLLKQHKQSLNKAFLTVGIFLALASIYIVKISVDKGRFSYGDNGRMNTIFHINDVTPLFHWRGGPEGNGMPKNPFNVLHENPQVYEYATPIKGTYPLWYDPAYYYEGVKFQFTWGKHFHVIGKSFKKYVEMYLVRQPILLVGLIALLLVSQGLKPFISRATRQYFLLAPCLFVMCGYFFVYVDWRYMGPFVCVCFMSLFASVPLKASGRDSIRLPGILFMINLILSLSLVIPTASKSLKIIKGKQHSQQHYDLAKKVLAQGIKEGDHLAFIGDAASAAFWARLIRCRIVAEVPPQDSDIFNNLTIAEQESILDILRTTKVKAVLSDRLQKIDTTIWTSLDHQKHHIHIFD